MIWGYHHLRMNHPYVYTGLKNKNVKCPCHPRDDSLWEVVSHPNTMNTYHHMSSEKTACYVGHFGGFRNGTETFYSLWHQSPHIRKYCIYILRTAQQKPNNQNNQRILFHRTKRIFQNMFVEQWARAFGENKLLPKKSHVSQINIIGKSPFDFFQIQKLGAKEENQDWFRYDLPCDWYIYLHL